MQHPTLSPILLGVSVPDLWSHCDDVRSARRELRFTRVMQYYGDNGHTAENVQPFVSHSRIFAARFGDSINLLLQRATKSVGASGRPRRVTWVGILLFS